MAEKKRKVLFIITKGNLGGAQRYVYDLATSLPKSRFESFVACGEGEGLLELLKEKGVKTIKIDKLVREVKFLEEFKVCSEIVRLIRTEKPDIIHLNSSKIGGVGAVAGRIAGFLEKDYSPKIIFTSHGWAFNEKHRSSLSRRFYLLSHWITVLLCDHTIAVSEKTKRDISWLPFIKGKITLIHNGVETFETLKREEVRGILSPGQKDKVILYSISELHKNKGVDTAMRAIALLPEDLKLKIVYSVAGSGEEKENLENLRAKLGLESLVNFLGFVQDAKKYLSGADIFLFPSRTENLPFAILEAGLAGLPIISTSVGGIPEIIKDMQNGILVHKENPREIAEAIKYMMNHKAKQIEFGKKIKSFISKNFSKTKMVRETINSYQ